MQQSGTKGFRAYSKDEFESLRGPLWAQYVARLVEEDDRDCVDSAKIDGILVTLDYNKSNDPKVLFEIRI